MNEFAGGIGQTGAAVSRQIVVGGDAERPDLIGDLNLSLLPTDRLIYIEQHLHQHPAHQRRFRLPRRSTPGSTWVPLFTFQYLGVRTVVNASDVDYRLAKWIGVYAGYNYSDRLVRTIQGAGEFNVAGTFGANTYDVVNIPAIGRGGRAH